MGVSIDFYSVLGINLKDNKKFKEHYEELMELSNTANDDKLVKLEREGFYFIADNMSSDGYLIFGKVLFQDDRYGEGDAFKETKLSELNEHEVISKFNCSFPEFASDTPKVKLFTFLHYS